MAASTRLILILISATAALELRGASRARHFWWLTSFGSDTVKLLFLLSIC